MVSFAYLATTNTNNSEIIVRVEVDRLLYDFTKAFDCKSPTLAQVEEWTNTQLAEKTISIQRLRKRIAYQLWYLFYEV